MSDSSTISHTTTSYTNESSTIKTKSISNFKGSTMMVKLTKVCRTSVRMSINFNLKNGRCYGEHVTTFRSYVTLLS